MSEAPIVHRAVGHQERHRVPLAVLLVLRSRLLRHRSRGEATGSELVTRGRIASTGDVSAFRLHRRAAITDDFRQPAAGGRAVDLRVQDNAPVPSLAVPVLHLAGVRGVQ